MNQVTAASIKASMIPGTMPAMNSAPIEVLAETPYSTRMIRVEITIVREPAAEIPLTPNRRAATGRITVLAHGGHHDRADRFYGSRGGYRNLRDQRASGYTGKAESSRHM